MKKEDVVFLNGSFLSKGEAKISVLEPSLLYGWGLFETMRSYKGNILYLDAHIRRLEEAAGLIDIRLPYPGHKIKSLIKKTIAVNSIKDAYVRLSVWKQDKGSLICIFTKPYQSYSRKIYEQGFNVCVSKFKQNEASILCRIKSTNYLLFQLAYREAKRQGFNEALILNSRDYIAECSRSNIFLIKGKQLFTPCLDCGCLNGITRKIVLNLAKKCNIKVFEENLTLRQLREADEAFLTNSLMGIMPLVSLAGRAINKGLPGKITKVLIKKYNSLLNR